MSQKERRKSPRVRAHRLVSFRRSEDSGTTDYEGFVRTLNLGLGGLLLETDYVFEPGEPLRLEILSGDSVLRAKGEVVYREGSGKKFKVGVRFTEISQETLGGLEEEVGLSPQG
ncbi:MAG: PilZ domain-containing protein [Anaerolineae bacterium]